MLDEPEQLGCERRLGQRHGPVRADPRGELHDVVVGEARNRPAVRDVDHLDVSVSAESEAISAVAASL